MRTLGATAAHCAQFAEQQAMDAKVVDPWGTKHRAPGEPRQDTPGQD
jgi:hypothetical protein